MPSSLYSKVPPGHARPDVRHPQQLEHAGRNFGAQLLVEPELAGVEQLADLVGDRLANAGDGRELAALADAGERRGEAGQRVAGAAVGPGAKLVVAQDLHRVGDRVEDVGDLAVGQCCGHNTWVDRARRMIQRLRLFERRTRRNG
jgi:hypothetical protein